MPIVPWRLKAFLSRHFPLGYHLAVNLGASGNSEEHWNRMLAQSWNDRTRTWPTKVELIASLTHPDMAILDVACGTGSILRELHRKGYSDLHALEISSYAVARLNAEGIEARRGKLPQIAYPDHAFDVVIASQVLEHLIRRAALAKEIRRVLKPGGRAFVFVPDNCLGPIDEPEHVIVYVEKTLRSFLARHFVVNQVKSMRDANHPAPVLFAEVRT